MNKSLFLLRHGKSDWSQTVSDFKRPLKVRGISETVRIGTWLRENNYVPDLILSSAAERAFETATLVCESLGLPRDSIEVEEGLYMACEETLQEFVQSTPESVSRLMLVGHNPGLENFLLQLVGKAIPHADVLKILPTATVACVGSEGKWKNFGQSECRLEFIKRGKQV